MVLFGQADLYREGSHSRRRLYLTVSVYKVVWDKSIPAQIRQLVRNISNKRGQVDGFVREWTFAKRHCEHFL